MKKKKRKREHNKPGKTTLQIWDVPIELKRDFNAACAKEGKPIKWVVMDLMKQFIQDVES